MQNQRFSDYWGGEPKIHVLIPSSSPEVGGWRCQRFFRSIDRYVQDKSSNSRKHDIESTLFLKHSMTWARINCRRLKAGKSLTVFVRTSSIYDLKYFLEDCHIFGLATSFYKRKGTLYKDTFTPLTSSDKFGGIIIYQGTHFFLGNSDSRRKFSSMNFSLFGEAICKTLSSRLFILIMYIKIKGGLIELSWPNHRIQQQQSTSKRLLVL